MSSKSALRILEDIDHEWVMYRGSFVPLCRYCQTSSLEAQKAQPETKGVGPCPVLVQHILGHIDVKL